MQLQLSQGQVQQLVLAVNGMAKRVSEQIQDVHVSACLRATAQRAAPADS